MEPYRVVIIDDHVLMRQGFIAVLGGEWQVVGEASTAAEARAVFPGLAEKPHLVVLDFALAEGESALDFLCWLGEYYRARNPPESPPPVLVYSAFSSYAHVSAALSMGARGYLSKAEGLPALKDAMFRTVSGELVIGNDVVYQWRGPVPLIESLTAREKEIVLAVQKGWNDAHIRREFGISQRTVETYLHRVYTKLGFTNRKELQSLKATGEYTIGGGGAVSDKKISW
jgi:DNA-binding NarL/FixJ family response regulator